MHTAVKIAPEYEHGVVHVLDACRSVTVAGSLLNKDQKPAFLEGIRSEYDKLKTDFGNKKSTKQYLKFADAQKNGSPIDWPGYQPVTPTFTGTKIFDNYSLKEIAEYIDWQPFFIAWEMHGKFPQILSDPIIGTEATKLFNDAKKLLQQIIDENWLTAKGAVGFWEAIKTAPDTVSVKNEKGGLKLEFLRQQVKKAAGQPNHSLADFIAPAEMHYHDHVGAFSVTIQGIEPHIKRFEENLDDYNKIILQALADRLAEAFAELLHKRTRKEYWGYDKNETLKRRRINKRRIPGHPPCAGLSCMPRPY